MELVPCWLEHQAQAGVSKALTIIRNAFMSGFATTRRSLKGKFLRSRIDASQGVGGFLILIFIVLLVPDPAIRIT